MSEREREREREFLGVVDNNISLCVVVCDGVVCGGGVCV
jgi:hypothetical protein